MKQGRPKKTCGMTKWYQFQGEAELQTWTQKIVSKSVYVLEVYVIVYYYAVISVKLHR